MLQEFKKCLLEGSTYTNNKYFGGSYKDPRTGPVMHRNSHVNKTYPRGSKASNKKYLAKTRLTIHCFKAGILIIGTSTWTLRVLGCL